jgi:hypothetical protein
VNNRVEVFTSDVNGPLLEIQNKKFDLIITSGILVYVPHEETVKKLSSFVIPRGYFFNIPNRDSVWGRLVCRVYACAPYTQEENIAVFERNGFELTKDVEVPRSPAASFKEAHLFRKLT